MMTFSYKISCFLLITFYCELFFHINGYSTYTYNPKALKVHGCQPHSQFDCNLNNRDKNAFISSTFSISAMTAERSSNTERDKFEFNVPLKQQSGIELPSLTSREKMMLAAGERIQKQERNGCSGSGLVVLDVAASPDVVFDTLCRFDSYEKMIPTVRSVKIFSRNDINTVAEFSLSRFMLRVNVIHTIQADQRLIKFSLDQSRPNLALRRADGFWYVQAPADRPAGYSRVFFSSQIIASRLLPSLVIDYAASRALPRATKWLQPYFANLKLD